MAITNAQQYQQLVNKPAGNKRPGYRGSDYGDEAKGTGAYSGKQEANYQSAAFDKESPNRTNTSIERGGGEGSNIVDEVALTGGTKTKPNVKEEKSNILDIINPFSKDRRKFQYNASMLIPGQKARSAKYQKAYRDYLISMGVTPPDTLTGEDDNLADFFVDNAFDKPVAADANVQTPQSYGDFLLERFGAPGVKFSGNVGGKEVYVKGTRPDGSKIYDVREKTGGGDGAMSDYERRLLELEQAQAAAAATPEVEEDEIINYRLMADGGRASFMGGGGHRDVDPNDLPPPYKKGFENVMDGPDAGIAAREYIANQKKEETLKTLLATTPEEDEIINYRLMADGGRAGFAEGGMPYEGGIMDLESSRQMYGLGKLVKKITRGVKKIAKSPIGKAAIIGGLGYLTMGGGAGSLGKFFGKGSFNPFLRKVAGDTAFSGLGSILSKAGLVSKAGGLTALGSIGIPTALSYFMTPEEEEEQKLYAGADIDDPRYIMNNPSLYTNRRLAAEGGSMDEPVAKKTMPLLDMDGQEMDLRAEGGFVPLGRMERADDVPARLSKNEFVFTADAVRNAGEGDVDKGAEVMYNMMKNLESGGEVSEESQGLEGAREMFQTSQRLEEVI